jgi:hypothetical protein
MKWQQTLSLAALSALSVSLFSACVKDLPYDRLQKEVNSCPILVLDAFEQYVPGIPVEFARFRVDYNMAGNPTDMIFTSGDYNTADDRYFRYDHFGRLSDFALTPHGSSGSLIWNRYGYPDRNTITDTIFDYAGDVDSAEPPHASFDTYLYLFKLDDLGRIIKSTTFYGSFVTTEPVSILTFAYDAAGDAIQPGVTYDDKINPYQTNKVWMLTNNDYSVHNVVNGPLGSNGFFGIGGPISIPSYNALGLPLEMDGNINLFGDNFGDQLKIEYGCDSVPSKGGSMGR